MNQKQKKLMFNQSFETGGRTVFKVGGGFQILPQGKAGMIQNNFKVLVILKYFKVLAGLRSQFEYSTSDFTGITKPSCIKKARLFKKHSDFEIPVKSSVSYLNYAFVIVSLTWLAYFMSHDYLSYIISLGFLFIFGFSLTKGQRSKR